MELLHYFGLQSEMDTIFVMNERYTLAKLSV